MCKCLEGHLPKDWNEWSKGKFSGGCVRHMPLNCVEVDSFLRLCGMKFPD